jgi:tyrosyl-tRNA synthetase
MTSSISAALDAIRRGTVEIVPEAELVAKLERSEKTGVPLRVKLGCDPTRPDLHLGHSVILRKLRQFQDLGHHAILIIGDFTGMIGDPTGANKTRPSLTIADVRKNGETYFQQASKILDTDPEKLTIVHNSDWLGAMSFEDVIRLASKFTVARMIERDDFTKRFEANEPISLHEFLYPLAQGQDSVYLKSDVELGGSDQKFNLLVGRDLQRADGQEPQVALMMPLLVGTDGVNKMSKSYDNYIGLDESPAEMYVKVMRLKLDSLVYTWFELLTDVPTDELPALKARCEADPHTAKHELAYTLTRLYHGETAAQAARDQYALVVANALNELEETQVPVPDDKRLVALMTAHALAPSASEARRLIQQGGVSVNDEKITDPNAAFAIEAGTVLIIRVGKRKFIKLSFTG